MSITAQKSPGFQLTSGLQISCACFQTDAIRGRATLRWCPESAGTPGNQMSSQASPTSPPQPMGVSPLGWPLHEDHAALLFPGARAEYEGEQRDRSWPRKKADQTRKTLEEACSHWASEVQAVFIVSISFLGLEWWTQETWVGLLEQGGSPGAWSGQWGSLPVPPKHQGAGNRLCQREKAESGLQSSEALRRESKDRSVCEPRERALRGCRGQGRLCLCLEPCGAGSLGPPKRPGPQWRWWSMAIPDSSGSLPCSASGTFKLSSVDLQVHSQSWANPASRAVSSGNETFLKPL